VLEGHFEFLVDDRTVECGPGTFLHLPKGTVHTFRNTGEPDPNPDYRDPLFYYGHGNTAETGCSITGGAFYDPATVCFPAQYQGDYFYADFCGGWIRSFDLTTGTSSAFASGIVKPIDLDSGDNGFLYHVTWGLWLRAVLRARDQVGAGNQTRG
jgi:hypothetical protein